MQGLSSTLKPSAMMFWGLLSLLLFAVASASPIGSQDEDIQVQENFEAERVTATCSALILGAEGVGRRQDAITYAQVRLCGRGVGSMAIPGCQSEGASLPAPAFGMVSPWQTPRQEPSQAARWIL